MSSAQVSEGNERFNSEAANWDTNPVVLEATRHAFQTLKPIIQTMSSSSSHGLDVLEVGCGTGLLTTQVAGLVNTIVAIDPAAEMIKMLQTKLTSNSAPKNILPIAQLLEDPEDPALPPADPASPFGQRRKYDLITSHLVLHHVPDLEPFLKVLLGCLKPRGRVALTDFEDFGPQAKYFHPPSKLDGVERHGIPREGFADLMRKVGFIDVNVWVGWTMDVSTEEWSDAPSKMPFPFLVCEGARP
ncbi:hypothetical protein N7539_007076 [Penicillium diatomitis]|uniref:S-adenosyl-L-methionine-dependent methyltransferase n=1 Tax=Penicillium diatomitis TaxID=2819901 RepID=A0A9W9X324_9EURO|nr:uncharacterized protein N7539_007076 [Penicillium diatomitis]KAJ5481182.1 hypothetical protein N7539_007076 [Penicillium diatomitis]